MKKMTQKARWRSSFGWRGVIVWTALLVMPTACGVSSSPSPKVPVAAPKRAEPNATFSSINISVRGGDSLAKSDGTFVHETSTQLALEGFSIEKDEQNADIVAVLDKASTARRYTLKFRRVAQLGELSTPGAEGPGCKGHWRCEMGDLVKQLKAIYPDGLEFHLLSRVRGGDRQEGGDVNAISELEAALSGAGATLSPKAEQGKLGLRLSIDRAGTRVALAIVRYSLVVELDTAAGEEPGCKGNWRCEAAALARAAAQSPELSSFGSKRESILAAESGEAKKLVAYQKKVEAERAEAARKQAEQKADACASLKKGEAMKPEALEATVSLCPEAASEADKETVRVIGLKRTIGDSFDVVKEKGEDDMHAFYNKYYATGDARVEEIRKLALKKFGPDQPARFLAARRSIRAMSSKHLFADLCDFRNGEAVAAVSMSTGAALLTLGSLVVGGHDSSHFRQKFDAVTVSQNRVSAAAKSSLGAKSVAFMLMGNCSKDLWYLDSRPWPPPKNPPKKAGK